MSFKMTGYERTLLKALAIASVEQRESALRAGAKPFIEEAKRRAPRKTIGEMESNVRVVSVQSQTALSRISVGIPSGDPAWLKARHTEYDYGNGSATRPRNRWRTKSKEGATMPWLHPAALRARTRVVTELRKVLLR